MATSVKVIKIDTDYIRQFMKDNKKRLDRLSTEMGHAHAFMTQRLQAGQMQISDVKLMCLLTGMKEEDVKKKEEPAPPDKSADLMQAAELVVSYIQDLGKIESDMLREIKELREDLKTALTLMNTRLEKQYNFFKYEKKP